MGNENFIQNTELKNEQLKDETETFNSFINVIRKDCFAGIRLCCVGYAALHITFPYKFMEVVR